jgi:hypothetical protein
MDDSTLQVITDIVMALIAVSIPPLVGVMVLWIKSKLNLAQQEKLAAAVQLAVQAAELLKAQNGWDGGTAKMWVITEVTKQFPKVNPDMLNLIIESCVAQLKTSGLELAPNKAGEVVLATTLPAAK